MLTIYLVCLSYLLIAADSQLCKPQYLFSTEAEGWLKLHTFPASWEKALRKCTYEGAVLASPLDAGLVNAIRSTMAQNGVNGPIFLGTHNLHSGHHFVSVEGVPLSNMKINCALQTSPDVSGLCLTTTVNGPSQYMNVTSCKDSLPYICYRKLDNRTMNKCGTFDDAYHLNKQTGSCYKVHHKKATWHNAYEICAAEGGHLVVIDDKEEALVIKNMFPTPPDGKVDKWDAFFIGLFAYGDPLDWITVNGDRLDDVYNYWEPGQPENTGRVASIIRSGNLDDINSDKKLMFICEKSPTALLFEPSPVKYSENGRYVKC
ncbi:killer cell lectin-like receptor subfamily B member 1A [Helicoverpa zea]|uniref:killer cell lectin-like receptor subfamily B member 1A n=1 Tax=Helicoverpa zea TaxID=7113 RepID=UPI001F57C640|nr:killer cell lectin-like receptor subfamily B member 1A [Helicoverpa zea]